MSDKMVDVTVHIDESIDAEARAGVQNRLLEMAGVLAATSHDERPHLMVVEYDPERTSSQAILAEVQASGVHAELVGL